MLTKMFYGMWIRYESATSANGFSSTSVSLCRRVATPLGAFSGLPLLYDQLLLIRSDF